MTPVSEIIAGVMILIGSLFVFVAAIGLVRMPDVYIRMHAATKAGTLGSGLLLLAVAVQADTLDVVLRAVAAVLFLIATTPVAAHLLGRAAYLSGVPLWKGTELDELEGKYDRGTRTLAGHLPDDAPHEPTRRS
ncbi:monovalent cation/H(+) antiporter subunit G [Rhodovibrio salinarum]|uniref:Na+/H+ antiporter subunit G n=1 Tax=Rhodovibrio salinarum TaxID=1087 RepID=A0A934QJ74_9PROT|nr:monovalent cation/H(+) antiporter subunit G [Rhodovibrio salinarum]MBK1698018.1 Na+/H+ antiporter subunit G [Rhodovibrio salinarum]